MSQEVDPKLLEEIDITADIGVPDDSKLKVVAVLANKALVLQSRIAMVIIEGQSLANQLKTLEEITLPDALRSAGISEFKLDNGAKVYLDEDMKISVPKKNMSDVCTWLRDNKHGDIIKNEIVVPIAKGKESEAQVEKLETQLSRLKLVYTREESVHSGTLKALLKEQRAKGVELNLSMFGAYEYSKVVVELPKEKKTK